MIVCRLIATLTGGFMSHFRTIKVFKFRGDTHMAKFSKKMCALDMTSSIIAYFLMFLIVGYIYIVMPAIFLLKAMLIILAEFVEQLTIFAFERIFNLKIINKRLINVLAIKPHIKRCFKNFYTCLAYDFAFFLIIGVSYVIFDAGTLYILVLGVLMGIRVLSLTPPKLLLK